MADTLQMYAHTLVFLRLLLLFFLWTVVFSLLLLLPSAGRCVGCQYADNQKYHCESK